MAPSGLNDRLPDFRRLLVVSLLVGLAAWGGITLFHGSGRVSPIWPANGLLLAVILGTHRRQWPAFLFCGYCANLAANCLTGDSLQMALGLAFCNSAEILVAALLIQRTSPSPFDMRQGMTLLSFAVFGVVVSPTLSSTLAVAWIHLISGSVPWAETFRTWFAADALGMLTVTPCVWALQQGRLREAFDGKNIFSSIAVLLLLALVTLFAFSQGYYPLLFTVFPFLLLVVFQLGFAGAAVAAFMVAVIAITLTVANRGSLLYLLDPHMTHRIEIIQVYIATTISTALPFAALLEQRKKLEQTIRGSEALYRELFENAPFGIYRSSTGSDRFQAANPALAAILGYSSTQEVMQASITHAIYSDRAEHQAVLEARRGQPQFEHEARWKRKDGKTIIVRLLGRTLPSNNHEDQYEVIAEDITNHRLLEEKLRQSQKMDAVGRLAGGVAHDFNNMLMVAINYARMIKDASGDPTTVTRYAERILDTSNRAAVLTQQLLAFSRKQPQKLSVLDLNQVVKEFSLMLPALIGEDIRLVVATKAQASQVKADRGQLEQVIMNLVVNARDAMPKGGRLTVETADADLTEHSPEQDGIVIPSGRYVLMAVTDTGTGIDEETRMHIFDPFFTTKDVGKGTGLGLATVYGIVKQSNGFIWVYSEMGNGTTFKIYLPLEVGEGIEEPKLQPQQAGTSSSETILLVEDQEPLRNVMHEYLSGRGFKLLLAEDGEAAVRIASSYKEAIHLLLTDVVMPGMRGPEVAKRVSALHPETCALYMSGYSDLALEGELQSSADMVQKPIDLETLMQRIREILKRRLRGTHAPDAY